jgi:hypothetical protein
LRNAQTRQLTHPLPVARAREIDLWARSADVLKLKRSGVFSPAPAAAREKHEAAARASLAASARISVRCFRFERWVERRRG